MLRHLTALLLAIAVGWVVYVALPGKGALVLSLCAAAIVWLLAARKF